MTPFVSGLTGDMINKEFLRTHGERLGKSQVRALGDGSRTMQTAIVELMDLAHDFVLQYSLHCA